MDSFCYHADDGKIVVVVVVVLVNFFVMVEDKLFRLLTLNGAKAFCNEDGIVHTTEKKNNNILDSIRFNYHLEKSLFMASDIEIDNILVHNIYNIMTIVRNSHAITDDDPWNAFAIR